MGSGVLELCHYGGGVHVLALRDRLDKMANGFARSSWQNGKPDAQS